MPGRADWIPLPIAAKLFQNIDEDALTRANAALENTFATEADGQSRFPGLKDFCTFPDNGRVYLHDFRGDLMAATSHGALFRVRPDGTFDELPGVSIAGSGRTIFTKTDQELVMSAGGPMVRYTGEDKVELLTSDPDAPLTTHTGYIDGFLLAIEKDSGRFVHSETGDYGNFDPLDTFAADGSPDNITALLVTPYREVLLFGEDSTEQFERTAGSATPFFRRYSVGEGLKGPYLTTFADNAVFLVNDRNEMVRVSGQIAEPVGDDIGLVLEKVTDWSDAWMGGFPDKPLHTKGQKFIVLQIPNTPNRYGTKGLTYLYDYRKRTFSELYGWDTAKGLPTRWPGWSHWPLWDKTFVGGEGKIYTVDLNTYRNGDQLQRWLMRTAFIHELGESAIDDVRLRIKRGIGTYEEAPSIRIRVNRDNQGFGPWVYRGLGKRGQRDLFINFGGFGQAHAWQFELECTADCAIELSKMEVQTYPIGS